MHVLFQPPSFFQLVTLVVLFIAIGALDTDVPSVTLPWGTWQAKPAEYKPDNILLFENIRYGQPPIGELRFQAPNPPKPLTSPEMTIMDNKYGPSCHQADTSNKCPVFMPKNAHNEDCLFLDVHVPQSVWDNRLNRKIPVVVWFHGGAYEFGAKSAYAFNYRLGAFGWLSGSMMEQHGRPNAGFYDQRLVLEFVRDHIENFGGDKDEVSAWGESAEAGSILHHLIAGGGKQDPLFNRALVQSPAFQWQWDRAPGGTLDRVYKIIAEGVGCLSDDSDELFACVVDKPASDLVEANQALWDRFSKVGLFQLGPALDNDTFAELSAGAYSRGHVWPNLKSLVISHVSHEPDSFLPAWVNDEDTFNIFMRAFMRENGLDNIRESIITRYRSRNNGGDPKERVKAIIGDSVFYCNTRDIFDYYHSRTNIPVYMMQYDLFGEHAKHATDLLPTFWTKDFKAGHFIAKYVCGAKYLGLHHLYAWYVGRFTPYYQIYLANFAVYGKPTISRDQYPWGPATPSNDNDNDSVEVLKARWGWTSWFETSADPQTKNSTCSFWTDVAERIMTILDSTSSPSDHVNVLDSARQPIFQLDLKRRARRNDE